MTDITITWDGDRAPLAKAFVAAQKATEAVKKASTNPAFRSKYADLAGVVEAVVPALNAAGVGVMQFPGYDGELVTVTTTFLHEGGSSVTSTLALRPSKQDPQGIGSAVTYGRRYSLLAMSGAAPEDDDGNAASGPARRADPPALSVVSPPSPSGETLTEAQSDEIRELVEATGTDLTKFLRYMKANTIGTIPASQFDTARAMLTAKAGRNV